MFPSLKDLGNHGTFKDSLHSKHKRNNRGETVEIQLMQSYLSLKHRDGMIKRRRNYWRYGWQGYTNFRGFSSLTRAYAFDDDFPTLARQVHTAREITRREKFHS
jgi:hypothetical protein